MDISTSDIISNILKKYKIKESEEELAKKYFWDDIDSNGAITLSIALKLTEKKESEESLIEELAKKLNISQETSNQIMEEVKKILLPVLTNKKTPIPAPLKSKKISAPLLTKNFSNKNDAYREPIE